jgi:hypothetical protein
VILGLPNNGVSYTQINYYDVNSSTTVSDELKVIKKFSGPDLFILRLYDSNFRISRYRNWDTGWMTEGQGSIPGRDKIFFCSR